MGRKVPSRNKSPFGWWAATIVERFEFDDEDTLNPRRRCLAWSNLVLLKARDRNHAYRKAIAYGDLGTERESTWVQEKSGRKGKWIFEGLSSLLPVYDPIDEDGTEIVWEEHERITVGRVKSWVRDKEDLEVFDDSDD
jgi:hypothetical protein